MKEAPCYQCPVLAMCKFRGHVRCKLLSDFMESLPAGERNFIITPLKELLGVQMIGWNDLTDMVSFIRADQMRAKITKSKFVRWKWKQ